MMFLDFISLRASFRDSPAIVFHAAMSLSSLEGGDEGKRKNRLIFNNFESRTHAVC